MKTKVRRKRSRQQNHQKRNWIPVGLLVVGVLLVAISLYSYLAGPSTAAADTSYAPEDVATTQPIFAVHEMNEGPPIPFLPKNQAQPDIQVPEKFYDFGTIGPQDVVEREFIIRNTGEAPLTISRAYTTCGCTTAEVSASVIPPGKVATVKLIFDAGFHDTAGQTVRRGIIFENNDPGQSQSEIWVQAQVRSN
ncbi:MAG: DUF1573 domain-containing protein [Anaerolineales bacterium]|nr:DUF1573 domain-containing protein [Anaerolineales bacterium]